MASHFNTGRNSSRNLINRVQNTTEILSRQLLVNSASEIRSCLYGNKKQGITVKIMMMFYNQLVFYIQVGFTGILQSFSVAIKLGLFSLLCSSFLLFYFILFTYISNLDSTQQNLKEVRTSGTSLSGREGLNTAR